MNGMKGVDFIFYLSPYSTQGCSFQYKQILIKKTPKPSITFVPVSREPLKKGCALYWQFALFLKPAVLSL